MSETRRVVLVAQAQVARRGEELVTIGLGSCVAILLHDPQRQVAGLAHVLLPTPSRPEHGEGAPAKFASTAVPHLVRQMERLGAERSRLVARLVGGASMFGSLLAAGSLHTGERNVLAARAALESAGIPLVGEEVGQEHGRSVYFDAAGGRVRVLAAERAEVEL